MRTTPFHERTTAANETGLWNHWAGTLVPTKYRIDEKVEYYALRQAAAVLDTSALYKYRITGPDAEAFLAGVLARDIRKCHVGRAQYTMWCDDRGFIIEDGVALHVGGDEYWLGSAEPNLAYFEGRAGNHRVEIDDVTDAFGILAVQGPASRSLLSELIPEAAELGFFGVASAKIGDASVVVSRTGYTGDLGYELWIERDDAIAVWDAVCAAGRDRGVLPYGSVVMHMARIEAGLLLIDVDYQSSRFAWVDEQRATPIELGYGWMFRHLERDDRPFVGRRAIERELAEGSSRFRLVGLVVDWRSHEEAFRGVGLPAAKDHVPIQWALMVYDGDVPAGYASGFMYSPLLQQHIAMARVGPGLADPGRRLSIEVTINNRNHLVDAVVRPLPFYDPPHKAA